jgi:hypothetical protein
MTSITPAVHRVRPDSTAYGTATGAFVNRCVSPTDTMPQRATAPKKSRRERPLRGFVSMPPQKNWLPGTILAALVTGRYGCPLLELGAIPLWPV